MAKPLYPGCDVWMNNPLRPYEACGTSGMKAALNGAANLSIRDGWWDEWFDPAFGWEIPSAEGIDDPDRRDDLEAKALYDIIENEIVPRFYDLDRDGLPERWIQMIRETVAGLGPKVLASRMVRDYVTNLYAPAAASTHAVDRAAGGAAALADWKRKIRSAWSGVAVDHVESLDGDQVEVGAKIHVSTLVRLGELSARRRRGPAGHRPDGQRRAALRPAGQPVPDRGRGRRRAAPLRGLGRGQAGRRDRLHRAGRAAPPAAGQPGRDGPGHPAGRPRSPTAADYAPMR